MNNFDEKEGSDNLIDFQRISDCRFPETRLAREPESGKFRSPRPDSGTAVDPGKYRSVWRGPRIYYFAWPWNRGSMREPSPHFSRGPAIQW